MKIDQREKLSFLCSFGSISDQNTHNYLGGIQALQLEDGSGSDELDVLNQLQGFKSLWTPGFSRAFPGLCKLRKMK